MTTRKLAARLGVQSPTLYWHLPNKAALVTAIGLTIMSGLDGYPLVVPWPTVLLLGVGVPALGVLAVGALTRSRLPMVRRLG